MLVLNMSFAAENRSQPKRKSLRCFCASLAFLSVLSCFAYLQSVNANAAENELKSSLDFIKLNGLGRDIDAMTRRFAPKILGGRSARIIFNACGVKRAQGMVDKHLAVAILNYRPEWDANLAESYEKHFTLKEMRSLYLKGDKSEYSEKLADKLVTISVETRPKNIRVVQSIWGETLKAMYAEAAQACKS